ncbi:hypothetical protein [Burkholderia territorii]|uniref:hypothetical protein n=1 Tax=Burkholderia territorii TaxID=1503055 RepID=UPI0012D8C50C|nr:hypothetical protein [Burkholderia territorii]
MNTTNEPRVQVDPSKLTLWEILKALSVGQAVAIGATVVAILTTAYVVGRHDAEVRDAAKLASVTADRGQCQTELSGARQQIATLTQSNAQLTGTANAESVEIGTLRQRLVDASAANAGQKNCDFIHAQIKDAEDEIQRLRSDDVFAGSERPDADARVKALDQRIAGYQAQLGTCGNGGAAVGSER